MTECKQDHPKRGVVYIAPTGRKCVWAPLDERARQRHYLFCYVEGTPPRLTGESFKLSAETLRILRPTEERHAEA